MAATHSFETRGHTCAPPPKGRGKINNWSPDFTKVWGPEANKPTKKKG